MALSAEQKQLNKRRNAIRDRLHRERRAEHDRIEAAAVVRVDEAHTPTRTDAERMHQELLAEKDAQVKAIEEQIAALQRQKEDTEAKYEPHIAAAAHKRRYAQDRWRRDRAAAQEDVSAQFPDLSLHTGSLFSAPVWAATEHGKAVVEAAWRDEGLLDEAKPASRRRGPKA